MTDDLRKDSRSQLSLVYHVLVKYNFKCRDDLKMADASSKVIECVFKQHVEAN